MKKPKLIDIELVIVLNNQAAILKALSIMMKSMVGNIEMADKLNGLFEVTLNHVETRYNNIEKSIDGQSSKR